MKRKIIDVREPSEFAGGHVAGAINIPISKLISGEIGVNDIPKDTEIILYCNSGSRSNVTGNILRSLGFTNVTCCIDKSHVEKLYGKN
jgi:rhodanese-related sulfurtransferase